MSTRTPPQPRPWYHPYEPRMPDVEGFTVAYFLHNYRRLAANILALVTDAEEAVPPSRQAAAILLAKLEGLPDPSQRAPRAPRKPRQRHPERNT